MQPLRVTMLGGLNMDLIVRVPQLPRPGETVSGNDLLRAPGGKGANQAVAAARLGASVTMVGRVGRDPFGRELIRSLRDNGVATRFVGRSERPSGAALIFVDEHGENCIAVAAGANGDLQPDHVPRQPFESADVVVAALEVPLDSIEAAFRIARQGGARTLLNAAPAQPVPESLLSLTDVVICNEVELSTLLGSGDSTRDVGAAARRLRRSTNQVVVVTLGERGALAISDDGTVSKQAAFPVATIDSVGAGDAFVAGFIVGRWFEAGAAEALRWGCAAGALATTKAGAQPSMPALADVRVLLDANLR